jgi:hypothetical protein
MKRLTIVLEHDGASPPTRFDATLTDDGDVWCRFCDNRQSWYAGNRQAVLGAVIDLKLEIDSYVTDLLNLSKVPA